MSIEVTQAGIEVGYKPDAPEIAVTTAPIEVAYHPLAPIAVSQIVIEVWGKFPYFPPYNPPPPPPPVRVVGPNVMLILDLSDSQEALPEYGAGALPEYD